MDKSYWNRVARDYDGEIFDVLAADRRRVVLKAVKKFASKDATACDFGCGIGKLLPTLSKHFGRVIALDISKRCLRSARRACRKSRNITYRKVDLSKPKTRLDKVPLGVCVNVAMTASPKKRERILTNVTKHIARGGHLVLVVPSLESALLANFRLIQWHVRDGWSHGKASRSGLWRNRDEAAVCRGIVPIENVPTKHYLKEELQVLLKERGMSVIATKKVKYSWKTEFADPPKWMKKPYPWDWLVVAERRE